MDRGARIMAARAQMDMGKLDEALQIRQAEKILQERGETKEKDAGRDFGMERYGIGWRVLVREEMGCERRSRRSVVFRS